MVAGIRHPVSMHLYTAQSRRRVRVDGRNAWGLFSENGEWLDGAIRSADPTFCRWVTSGFVIDERQAAAKI
jgi:hypothetical protein